MRYPQNVARNYSVPTALNFLRLYLSNSRFDGTILKIQEKRFVLKYYVLQKAVTV